MTEYTQDTRFAAALTDWQRTENNSIFCIAQGVEQTYTCVNIDSQTLASLLTDQLQDNPELADTLFPVIMDIANKVTETYFLRNGLSNESGTEFAIVTPVEGFSFDEDCPVWVTRYDMVEHTLVTPCNGYHCNDTLYIQQEEGPAEDAFLYEFVSGTVGYFTNFNTFVPAVDTNNHPISYHK